MAWEKKWHMTGSINVNVDGTNTQETAQNWLYQLYTMLSGGAGNANAAWEIVSSSNGVDAVGAGGMITSSADFIWANTSTPHTWFTFRHNMAQTSGSYIYFTLDCLRTGVDGKSFKATWDSETPNFSSVANDTAPTPTQGYEYKYNDSLGGYFMYDWDVAYPTYFHGAMNESGSFFVVSARQHVTAYNYPFAMHCMRLETPRSLAVDTIPIVVAAQYNTSNHGPYDWASISYFNTYFWNPTRNANGLMGAMWSPTTRVATNSTGYNADGGNTTRYLGGSSRDGTGLWSVIGAGGDNIDGTFAALPIYAMTLRSSEKNLRGRVPDILVTAGVDDLAGWTIPATGTPEYCILGDLFFPVTASLLPGTP